MPILTKLHAFSLLTPYKPFDLAEAQHLARTLEFLRATDAPFFRDTLAGHITASAILTDPAQSNLLLIWHEKLRRWLQPGGHCEQDDVSLSAAARRELLEETGLPQNGCILATDMPFDVDVHPIPVRGAEPAHWHYDIRFLFVYGSWEGSERSEGSESSERSQPSQPSQPVWQWRAVEEVAQWPEASLARLAQKLRQ